MNVCTECGKPKATERHLDADGEVHWFHPLCWKNFCAWMRGESVKRISVR
jgi:hypothetical protein